jgi:hypothetical protein
MKTFKCTASADVFAHLFELISEKDILKLSDGNFYEAHYGCCTFNTQRKNSFQHLTRIQLAPCSKTNLPEDWRAYWFYLKVDMSQVSSYTGPTYPFYSPMAPVTAVTTATFNSRALGFKTCENAFFLASTILGGRDVIEEFVAARVWPLSHDWKPSDIVFLEVDWASQKVSFPRFNLRLEDGQSLDDFILEVEERVTEMVGEFTPNKYKAFKNIVKHKKRVDHMFSELGAEAALRSCPPGVDKKIPAVVVPVCSTAPPKD